MSVREAIWAASGAIVGYAVCLMLAATEISKLMDRARKAERLLSEAWERWGSQ